MKLEIVSLLLLLSSGFSQKNGPLLNPIPQNQNINQEEKILAQSTLDLTNRDPDPEINKIFVDNILLSLRDLHSFVLLPGQVFAFHGNLLPEFEKELVVTIGGQFSAEEGYQQAYGIFGNGVCHLASLINWTATEAELEVIAKKDHDFSPIPGIPRRYGTLISYKEDDEESQEKNLYIKNNFDFPVVFEFKVEKNILEFTISKTP